MWNSLEFRFTRFSRSIHLIFHTKLSLFKGGIECLLPFCWNLGNKSTDRHFASSNDGIYQRWKNRSVLLFLHHLLQISFRILSFFFFFVIARFYYSYKIDVPKDTYDLKEFYMKIMKEEFEKLRQNKNQMLFVLDGMDEVRL